MGLADWPERAARVLRAQPDIATERLLLRRMRMDDADAVFEYARDPDVARFTSWYPHSSVEDSRRFLEWIVASYERGDGANWGIELRAERRFVGTIGFGVSPTHRSAEVGYALARPLWGRGLVTEALVAVLDLAFGTVGLHRVIARCEPENTGSWKVMKKVGMTFEGIQREAFYAKERFADLMVWSILDREWRARTAR
ncbi:MAG TPA: GNAT family protein [Candidatus Limnocylindria bacterium]|nr:GNAT family protein [Candidatus Limnocylindria bacterium]